jgi:hypothetical protein
MYPILLMLLSLLAPATPAIAFSLPGASDLSAYEPRREAPPHTYSALPVTVAALGPKVDEAGASVGRESANTFADAALAVLGRHVPVQSHPEALASAMTAYFNFRSAHPERVRKPYLYFVDYGLDHRARRGYVFDMDALTLVDGPFTVAEGRGSTRGPDGVPTRFLNVKNSAASSLGLYLTQETYPFRGTAAGRRYQSVGLRLQGLSGTFNSAARTRGIVVHGAPYVTADSAGRSEGCPAMEEPRAQKLLPRISNGALVFLFSPRDAVWMASDPWARR